jgi:CBS domain-containing protein
MLVSQLMTRPVWTCGPEETLDVAARLMWENDVGCVVVVDDSGVIGMLTDRDVCMGAYTTGSPLWAILVRKSMASPPALVRADATLEAAGRIMEINRVRRLPVVDGLGALVGLLSVDDLAREAQRERDHAARDVEDRSVVETLAAVASAKRPQEIVRH